MANQTFDPNLLQSTVTVNKDADAYADLPPVPEQVYMVRLKGPKDPKDLWEFKATAWEGEGDNRQPTAGHVNFKIQCVIEDPDNHSVHGSVLFPHVFITPSTKFQERSGTTTCISLLKRLNMGHLIESESISHQRQIELMQQVLASNPMCRVRTEWSLSRKTGKKNSNGYDEYETVYKGMANFPKDENGKPKWRIPADPLNPGGDQITARCEVVEFLPLHED